MTWIKNLPGPIAKLECSIFSGEEKTVAMKKERETLATDRRSFQ